MLFGVDGNYFKGSLDTFSPKIQVTLPNFDFDISLADSINEHNLFSFWSGEFVNINETLFSDVLWLLGQ